MDHDEERTDHSADVGGGDDGTRPPQTPAARQRAHAAPLALIDISLVDVLALVGLGLLIVAWQGFANGLLYPSDGFDEPDRRLRVALEAIPAVLLTIAALGLQCRTPRADRFAVIVLFLAGLRWLSVGPAMAEVLWASGWETGTAAGAIVWLGLAGLARGRSSSVYTDAGLAAAIAFGVTPIGEAIVGPVLGIRLFDYDHPGKDPGTLLAFAFMAWFTVVAAGCYVLARRLARSEWVRVLVFDATAAGVAALGIQASILRYYGDFPRAVEAPASTAILVGTAAILGVIGLRLRLVPYYVGAAFLVAVAYGDAAAAEASVLRSWTAVAAIGIVCAGLAVALRVLERRATEGSSGARATGWRRLIVPFRDAPPTGQLQDLLRFSLVDVFAAASAGFLLAAWFTWAVELDGRWSELIRHGAPAAAYAVAALTLLRRPGPAGRLAGLLALIAGVEIALAGSGAFVALTRNESGVGGLVGAAYWALFAGFVRARHGSFATQLGIIGAVGFLGIQGNIALPGLLFGSPEGDGVKDRAPGLILPVIVAAWWVAIGLALVALAARERRRSFGDRRRAASASVTEFAAAIILASGVPFALLNRHAGWERAIEPPASVALIGLLVLALAWLRARTASGYYLAGAGIALVFGAIDLNGWLYASYGTSAELLAAVEGVLLLAGAGVFVLRGRRAAPGTAVAATPETLDPGT